MHLPKSLKPFSLQIICSMCICLLAILLVRVEAEADTLFFLIIGGAERRTPWIARRSWMLKPLSAMTTSPSSNNLKMPDFCTISLSLMDPENTLETKLIWHIGDCDINNLKVFPDLYWLYVLRWLEGLEGFSMWNSVQSMIARRFFTSL